MPQGLISTSVETNRQSLVVILIGLFRLGANLSPTTGIEPPIMINITVINNNIIKINSDKHTSV